MRSLRHFGRLVKEFCGFAWQNKAWWILPIILVLGLIATVVVAGPVVLQWGAYAGIL